MRQILHKLHTVANFLTNLISVSTRIFDIGPGKVISLSNFLTAINYNDISTIHLKGIFDIHER